MKPSNGLPVKKILFLAPQPFMAHRGSPFRVRATLKALVSLGYSIDLLCFPFGEEEEIEGVTLHRSSSVPGVHSVPIGASFRKLLLDVPFYFKAAAMAGENKYSLIHGIEEAAFIARVLARRAKIPYIMDMHSSMLDQLEDYPVLGFAPIRHIFCRLENQALRDASGVVTVSDDLSNYARKISPLATVRTVNDLPLDSSGVVNPEAVAELKRTLNPEGRKVLLYSGNLKGYQGVGLLLDSFKELLHLLEQKGEAPPLLVIVGGDEYERKERQLFEAQAKDLGIKEFVHFAGLRPSHEMGNYLAFADIAVSPRLTGTNTPLKIYSYLQAERLIVATAIRSHTQVLTDAHAYLAEPVPTELAKALALGLSEDPADVREKEQKIACGAKLLAEQFSFDCFAANLQAVYAGAQAVTREDRAALEHKSGSAAVEALGDSALPPR